MMRTRSLHSRRLTQCSVVQVVKALVLSSLIPGCTVCHITLRDANAGNTVHGEGIRFGSQYIVAEADQGQFGSKGIHDVIVKDNLLYDLIGVATLGFFKPYEISYRNVTPGVDDSGDMSFRPRRSVSGMR